MAGTHTNLAMTDSLHEDADDLLHWLNVHSISISDGIPFSLMQQKWTASKRPYAQLRSSLEWLFGQGLLVMTPGLEQPHVRLSGKGFEQLLGAMDKARQPPNLVANLLAAVPASTMAAPKPVAATAPQPAPTVQPAAATLVQQQPAAMPVMTAPAEAAAAPSRFVDPAKQPTEIGLRNQVLTIFRDLKLAAGQQLIAMTLTRYWQETGQRGEHLRAGIDVMLRDGYVQAAVKRYENYWMLTPAGHAYLSAPISHPALLALAQPLRQIEESYPDEDLRRKGLGLFKKSPSIAFVELESSWKHSRDSLIHALDLLIKAGEVQLSPDEPLVFQLSGRAAIRR